MKNQLINLRALRRSDSALFYQWITDKDLMMFNSAYKPISEGEHEKWFESVMEKKPETLLFVIEDNSTGKAVGSCQLSSIDLLHSNAELQIRIGDSASRSKGMGSEAVLQLVNFGFKHLNLHRIYLNVFATNERAIKSYLNSGFESEGKMKEAVFIDGLYIDLVVMGIINKNK